jgi:hypothetical protein
MRARTRLDLILSTIRKYQWLIADETLDYEIDEDADTLYLTGQITFLQGTVLNFTEVVLPLRVRYRYHYSFVDNRLIFRYDNAPHHAEVNSFPHHKHMPTGILESSEKLLSHVLEEIVSLFLSGE